MLQATLAKQIGGFDLDVALRIPRGVCAVLGESGAGKSTLLRLLGGLARPDTGRITLDGELLFDSGARICRAPRARPIGWMPQDGGLFPHLAVDENVAFGLRALGVPRAEALARAGVALDRVGLARFGNRRPRDLSGGEQQRVALARALVLEPRLLLLDEPLAALDYETHRSVRKELRAALSSLEAVTLLVTHNPTEALLLGDRIVVLERGRVTHDGSREDLLRAPKTPFVAEFLGVNLLEARRVSWTPADGADRAVGAVGQGSCAQLIVEIEGRTVRVPPSWLLEDSDSPSRVRIAVPLRSVAIERVEIQRVEIQRVATPAAAQTAVFLGTIDEVLPLPPDGSWLRIHTVGTPSFTAEIEAARAAKSGLAIGEAVSLRLTTPPAQPS